MGMHFYFGIKKEKKKMMPSKPANYKCKDVMQSQADENAFDTSKVGFGSASAGNVQGAQNSFVPPDTDGSIGSMGVRKDEHAFDSAARNKELITGRR